MKLRYCLAIVAAALLLLVDTVRAESEYANINRDDFYVGVATGLNGGFTSTSTDVGDYSADSEDQAIDLTLNGGYFVADGLGLGVSTYIERQSSKDEEVDTTDSSNALGFGPVLRYYIDTGTAWVPLLAVGAGYLRVESKYEARVDDDNVYKTEWTLSGLYYSAGVGLAYFITPAVSLLGGVTYGATNLDGDMDVDTVSGPESFDAEVKSESFDGSIGLGVNF